RFLSGASAAVIRLQDRNELLKEACRLAVSVGRYRRATIFLLPLSAGAAPLYSTVERGPDGTTRSSSGERLPHERAAVVRAIETGEPVIVPDAGNGAARPVRMSDTATMSEPGTCASIALPLMMDRTPIGALELYGDERLFGEAERVLLKQVA